MSPHLMGALLAALSVRPAPATPIRAGISPQLALDARGTIRIIFGQADTIFAVTSADQGVTFSKPAVVGVVEGMHLGNTRGPVIASSRDNSLVLAGDKTGNIHVFRL